MENVMTKRKRNFGWNSAGDFAINCLTFFDICNWWKYFGSVYDNYFHEIYII